MKIGILLGSARNGRRGDMVLDWVMKHVPEISGVDLEVIDLQKWQLPWIDGPDNPMMGTYPAGKVQEWAAAIKSFDGFVIITPEYNHGYPGVLKNALDLLYAEWHHKPVGFIGYSGSDSGGIRAIEQLRQVVIELKMLPTALDLHIPWNWKAFDASGEPLDTSLAERVPLVVSEVVDLAKKVMAK